MPPKTAIAGGISSVFKMPTDPGKVRNVAPTEVEVDAQKVLSSTRFAEEINLLYSVGADELMYLKLARFTSHTASLLDLPTQDYAINYADNAETGTDRVNAPLIATVFHGMENEQVEAYMRDLLALPYMRRDEDYTTLAKGLIRSCGAQRRINEDFPGYGDAWQLFFNNRLKGIFTSMPDLVVEDENRHKLFSALSSIVTGKVPSGLSEFETELKEAHQAFTEGRVQDMADTMFYVTQKLTRTPPPEPPGSGDGGGGSCHDPFETLGEHLMNEDDRITKEPLNVEAKFAPPEMPQGLDLDKLHELQEHNTDICIPETIDGTAYMYLECAEAPNARVVFHQYVNRFSSEITRIRQIIEEYFRISTITERGLKSGRVDASRLYRVAFGKDDVFKRHEVDSVGHMDLVVLIDESGSMSHGVEDKDGKLSSVAGLSTGSYPNVSVMLGDAIPYFSNDRVGIARLMGTLLLEASRNLPGFNVEVYGYSALSKNSFGPFNSVASGVAKRISERSDGLSHLVPLVRQLGTQKSPYRMMSTTAFSENADIEALAFAVDKLAKSSAPQKGIIYLADGWVHDSKNHIDKLLNKARSNNVHVHFMDLSHGYFYKEGPLGRLPRTDVRSVQDMVGGLRTFLNRVVSTIG